MHFIKVYHLKKTIYGFYIFLFIVFLNINIFLNIYYQIFSTFIHLSSFF